LRPAASMLVAAPDWDVRTFTPIRIKIAHAGRSGDLEARRGVGMPRTPGDPGTSKHDAGLGMPPRHPIDGQENGHWQLVCYRLGSPDLNRDLTAPKAGGLPLHHSPTPAAAVVQRVTDPRNSNLDLAEE
jgi:hypothetical protein